MRWGAKSKVKQVQDYLDILKGIPESDRGFLVVYATEVRLQMYEKGLLSADIFDGPAGEKNKNYYERTQAAPRLCQLAESFQRDNQLLDVAAVMVWTHSLRGLITPEMVPLVKEMWAELSKGFPYATNAIPLFEMTTGNALSKGVVDNLDFIPQQFL